MDAFFEQWREPERIFTLGGLICLIGGIGMCLWGQWMVHQARSWQATVGRVVAGSMGRERATHGDAGNHVYVPKVAYEYDVGGRTYRSQRIVVGGQLNTTGRERAEARLARYPQGADVEVYFDPRDPSKSCLERTTEVLPMGALFAAAGVAMLLFFGL